MEEMICFARDRRNHRPARPEQREALFRAIRMHFPHIIAWVHRSQESALEVTLPHGLSARQLLDWSEREKVTFSPEPGNVMRLHFSHLEPDQIEEGVKRLGRAFTHYLHLATTVSGAASSYFQGP